MATINGMYIMVEDEDPKFGVNVTSEPVESGIDLSDHVQSKPDEMTITGYIVGENAAQTRAALIYAMKNGQIVTYEGRNSFIGLITEISPRHNYKVANGFSFSMNFKEIKIANSSYSETLSQEIRVQVAPVVSAGRKQTKSKAAKKNDDASGAADLSFWEG